MNRILVLVETCSFTNVGARAVESYILSQSQPDRLVRYHIARHIQWLGDDPLVNANYSIQGSCST